MIMWDLSQVKLNWEGHCSEKNEGWNIYWHNSCYSNTLGVASAVANCSGIAGLRKKAAVKNS